MHGNGFGESVSDERLRRWRWRRKRTLWGEEQAVQGEGGEGLGAEGGRARWVEGFARQQARLLQGAERETVEEGSGEGAITLGVLGTQRLLVLRMNPFMGFANRVWAVCSAMIMAVITERGLLVDWPADDVVRRVAGEMYLMPAMECLVSPPHVITLQALMSRYSQGTVASAAAALEHDATAGGWITVAEDDARLVAALHEGHVHLAFPQRVLELWSYSGGYVACGLFSNEIMRERIREFFGPVTPAAIFRQIAWYLLGNPASEVRLARAALAAVLTCFSRLTSRFPRASIACVSAGGTDAVVSS